MKNMGRTHMVIGDQHRKPGQSLERFHMLGEFALKYRPDEIIAMGDWADMESLCSYDFGKKSFEGRRYIKDVEASREALAAFNKPIDAYNRRQAQNRKVQWRPKKTMLGGNHDEARINRVIELDPKMDGTIGVEDLGFSDYGWEHQPFLMSKNIDGVLYNHYFVSGVMGRPIGGDNSARSMLNKNMMSSTAAHSHVFDYANRATPEGKVIHGLTAGCYFEESMDFAKATEHLWWRGIFLKHGVRDGDYDLEAFSMDRLRRIL
jgi:hypothetical protein